MLATEAVCSRAGKQNLLEDIMQCYWPSTFHIQSKKTFVSIICEEYQIARPIASWRGIKIQKQGMDGNVKWRETMKKNSAT